MYYSEGLILLLHFSMHETFATPPNESPKTSTIHSRRIMIRSKMKLKMFSVQILEIPRRSCVNCFALARIGFSVFIVKLITNWFSNIQFVFSWTVAIFLTFADAITIFEKRLELQIEILPRMHILDFGLTQMTFRYFKPIFCISSRVAEISFSPN